MGFRMKPEIEILTVYIFIILASILIYSLIPPSVSATQPEVFSTPQASLLYVAYIAVAGVTLAMILKYRHRLHELIDKHKVIILIIYAIMILVLLQGFSTLPSGLKEVAIAYIAFAIFVYFTYRAFKLIFGHIGINMKIIFIAFEILVVVSFGYSFNRETVLIFIAALAVYDFIAVFITKHMLIIAKELNNPILIYVATQLKGEQPSPRLRPPPQEEGKTFAIISRYGKYEPIEVKKDQRLKREVTQLQQKGLVPVIDRMGLGGGDFMAAGAVVLVMYRAAPLLGMIYFAGAVLGLLITFFVLRKTRRPLPAIPLICIGFAVSTIIAMII